MYILILESSSPIDEQTFSGCFFINCTTQYNQDNKGGIGFKHDNIKHLIFNYCHFNLLKSNGYGGAIVFNDLRSDTDGYSIEFNTCNFNSNSLTDTNAKGGSLYINVSYDVTIRDCILTDQSTNGYGGSIYCEYSCNLLIQNTSFYSTKETSGGRGNALYLNSNLPTCTITGDCKFVDCGDANLGSVIDSKVTEFIFVENTIEFTTQDKGSRGFYFPYQSRITIANSTISGCNIQNDSDGGLYYESGIENQINETYNEIEITNCTFTINKSNRHGGSCFFKNINNININDCLFDGNIANKQYSSSSSSQLLAEKNRRIRRCIVYIIII